jgi:hypothetical protein
MSFLPRIQSVADARGQVQAAEDLLQLTRELKELWLAGPLRAIGEDENEGKMGEEVNSRGHLARTALSVGEMVEGILQRASESKTGAEAMGN